MSSDDNTSEIEELRATVAALQHDRQVARGEYAYILDPEFYEFMPVAARRAHANKPQSNTVFNRIIGRYRVNEQRVYHPPPLHPVYQAFGPALATRDKEICQLAAEVANCLRPLDKILTILPEIMDHRRGPEFKDAIETIYEMVFQTMSKATEQRVQQLAKLLKAAPGEYDERIIVDPKPIVEARDAHAAFSAKVKPEPEDKGGAPKRNARPKPKRRVYQTQDARASSPEPSRPRQSETTPEQRSDHRDRGRDNSSRRNDSRRPNGRSRSRPQH